MIKETEIFLREDDFAEFVDIDYPNIGLRQVVCLFTEAGTIVSLGDNQILTTEPFIDLKKEDAEGILQNTRIIRNNVPYYVMHILDTGDGFVRLVLSKNEV